MKEYDVVVVGAGPAGLSSANEASLNGADTMVVDSGTAPGGQLVKQIHKFFGSVKSCAGVRGIRLADRFYAAAKANGCKFMFGTTAYSIDSREGGYTVYAADGEKTWPLRTKTVVLAIGASENAIAFKGWTKPGVITAGAAQTLVNQYKVFFGKRILMVGSGNVGLIVSYQMMQAGIDVAAIVEAAPAVGGYKVHADKVRRAGVPILTSHTVVSAEGENAVEAAVVAEVDCNCDPVAGTEQRFDVDTICLAVGLTPLVKLAGAAGCKLVKNDRNETVPYFDAHMMTSCEGIFVAGDASGVEEASIAIEEGCIAGINIAVRLGYKTQSETEEELEEAWKRLGALRKKGTGSTVHASFDKYMKYSKPKALIECFQGIPCNPCEAVCPVHAIKVGDAITGIPSVELDKCTGCGRCVVACPGMACYTLNMNHSDTCAELGMAYEYLPVPAAGSSVAALDRNGDYVCDGKVTKVLRLKNSEATILLKIAFPKEFAEKVRAIDRKKVVPE